jgi:hypothetical protein
MQAAALAAFLKTNNVLQTLDLTDTPIYNGGGQALAEAMEVNTALTSLRLEHNSLTDSKIKDAIEMELVRRSLFAVQRRERTSE